MGGGRRFEGVGEEHQVGQNGFHDCGYRFVILVAVERTVMIPSEHLDWLLVDDDAVVIPGANTQGDHHTRVSAYRRWSPSLLDLDWLRSRWVIDSNELLVCALYKRYAG